MEWARPGDMGPLTAFRQDFIIPIEVRVNAGNGG